MKGYLFTSESVSEGHPDKMADQISDSVLDAILAQDTKARVACETLITTGLVVVAGEITTDCYVDIPQIVRETINGIGYNDAGKDFDGNSCAVITSIDRQSLDIAQGVDGNKEQGAGDQGIMFGYAVDETPEKMPLTISLSHKILLELAKHRKKEKVDFLRPDSKSQVTVEYVDNIPQRIDTIVLSTQHSSDVSQEKIREFVLDEIVPSSIPNNWIDNKTKFVVNPTGQFIIGGPKADCGLTGRKIIVDTYGGHGAHGGGAFSGKDPSKVDRSAAYAARNVAKTIVAAGFAKKCLIQISYAIGIAEPVSIMVDHYGTGVVSSELLEKSVRQVWDLRPASIIKEFDLLKPIYKETASYGHFGRDKFTWEQTHRVDDLKDVVKTLS